MTRALLHIGAPRTGSTAFQRWIYANRSALEAQGGITLYDTATRHLRRAQMHPELLVLSQRPERDCVAKRNIPLWSTNQWQSDTRDHLSARVNSDVESLMFTHEGLFLLRYADEVERLAELLAPRELSVVVCVREPSSFLRSYRFQMEKKAIAGSSDPNSSMYLEDDTWQVDWEQLLATWRSVLGASNVISVDYEQAMATYGSTTQPLLEAFGINCAGLAPMTSRRANRSSNSKFGLLAKRSFNQVRRRFI
jgi:hypothetical protein